MNQMKLDQLIQWLETQPSELLQKINAETNRILLQRYRQETKEVNDYAVSMSSVLVMLGERKTKRNISDCIKVLTKHNNTYFDFKKLINKHHKELKK